MALMKIRKRILPTTPGRPATVTGLRSHDLDFECQMNLTDELMHDGRENPESARQVTEW